MLHRFLSPFNLSLSQVFICCVLIMLGTRKIPKLGWTLERMIRNLQKVTFDLVTEVTKEIDKKEKDYPRALATGNRDISIHR